MLFAARGAFFEVVLNLSGFFTAGFAGFLFPAVLIGAGRLLLVQRSGRWSAE